MPLIEIHTVNDTCKWGIWEIGEELEELRENLVLHSSEKAELSKINVERKKKEFLSVRKLMQTLFESWGLEYKGLCKDEYGKPYLVDSHFYISLSHTETHTVAIVHQTQPVGIDIEIGKEKLHRIASKFLSDEELLFVGNQPDLMTVCWAAKEALYKLYGKKKLIFKKEMVIPPFNMDGGESFIIKLCLANSLETIYQAHYRQWGHCRIVYCY